MQLLKEATLAGIYVNYSGRAMVYDAEISLYPHFHYSNATFLHLPPLGSMTVESTRTCWTGLRSLTHIIEPYHPLGLLRTNKIDDTLNRLSVIVGRWTSKTLLQYLIMTFA